MESTIAGIDRGQIPRALYGAVLIDEGHDFQPEWFKLVVLEQILDLMVNFQRAAIDEREPRGTALFLG